MVFPMKLTPLLAASLTAMLALGCAAAPGGAPASSAAPPARSPEMSATAKPAPVAATPAAEALAPLEPAKFWQNVAPPGANAESFGSIDEMTREADAVVLGRAVSIRPGRDLVAEEETGIIAAYATLTIAIDQVVAGAVVESAPGELNLELFLNEPTNYRLFAAGLPDEQVLLFLRSKGKEAEASGGDPDGPGAGYDYYRIVSRQGFFRNVNGTVEPPQEALSAWVDELAGTPFSDLLAAAAAAAAS